MKYLILALVLLSLPALAFAEGFVPLTSVPAFQNLADAQNLSGFLNGLYKICIGLAAVLAILQLVRAGIMYMGGDSITDKREARNLIMLALFGLLLVLSPVIVFGIINPDILSLRIDVSSIRVDTGSGTGASDPNINQFTTDQCSQYTDVEAYDPPATGTNAAPNCANRDGGEGSFTVPRACCPGISASAMCCGRNTSN